MKFKIRQIFHTLKKIWYQITYFVIQRYVFVIHKLSFNRRIKTNSNLITRRNLTMLKIVKTSLIIAASTVTFSNVANASVDEALANICTIVQADDKGELRKKNACC